MKTEKVELSVIKMYSKDKGRLVEEVEGVLEGEGFTRLDMHMANNPFEKIYQLEGKGGIRAWYNLEGALSLNETPIDYDCILHRIGLTQEDFKIILSKLQLRLNLSPQHSKTDFL